MNCLYIGSFIAIVKVVFVVLCVLIRLLISCQRWNMFAFKLITECFALIDTGYLFVFYSYVYCFETCALYLEFNLYDELTYNSSIKKWEGQKYRNRNFGCSASTLNFIIMQIVEKVRRYLRERKCMKNVKRWKYLFQDSYIRRYWRRKDLFN